jgi:hypothetical protein
MGSMGSSLHGGTSVGGGSSVTESLMSRSMTSVGGGSSVGGRSTTSNVPPSDPHWYMRYPSTGPGTTPGLGANQRQNSQGQGQQFGQEMGSTLMQTKRQGSGSMQGLRGANQKGKVKVKRAATLNSDLLSPVRTTTHNNRQPKPNGGINSGNSNSNSNGNGNGTAAVVAPSKLGASLKSWHTVGYVDEAPLPIATYWKDTLDEYIGGSGWDYSHYAACCYLCYAACCAVIIIVLCCLLWLALCLVLFRVLLLVSLLVLLLIATYWNTLDEHIDEFLSVSRSVLLVSCY